MQNSFKIWNFQLQGSNVLKLAFWALSKGIAVIYLASKQTLWVNQPAYNTEMGLQSFTPQNIVIGWDVLMGILKNHIEDRMAPIMCH